MDNQNNQFISSYRELKAYQAALEKAMQVFEVSREFPPQESTILTDPMIHAARLVCVLLAQAWQRRRYRSAFVARLNQAETAAASTQVWIEFAVLCSYLDPQQGQELHHDYQIILSELARLIHHADAWVIPFNFEL